MIYGDNMSEQNKVIKGSDAVTNDDSKTINPGVSVGLPNGNPTSHPRKGDGVKDNRERENIEVEVIQPQPTHKNIYNIEEKKRLVGYNLITSILEDRNISLKELVMVIQPLSYFINLTKTKTKIELTAMVLFSRYDAFYQRLIHKVTGYNNGDIRHILTELENKGIISETEDDVLTFSLKRLVFTTSKNKKNAKKIKFYVFNPPYSQLIKKFSNELYSLLPKDIKERINKLDRVLSVSNSNIEKLNNREENIKKLLIELAMFRKRIFKKYGAMTQEYIEASAKVTKRLRDVYLLDIKQQDVEQFVSQLEKSKDIEQEIDVIMRAIRTFYV